MQNPQLLLTICALWQSAVPPPSCYKQSVQVAIPSHAHTHTHTHTHRHTDTHTHRHTHTDTHTHLHTHTLTHIVLRTTPGGTETPWSNKNHTKLTLIHQRYAAMWMCISVLESHDCCVVALKGLVHFLTQTCNPISCYRKSVELATEIGLELIGSVYSTGFL